MRKQPRKNRQNRSARHSSITMVLIAIAVLAVAAVTVVSRQSMSEKQSTKTTSQTRNTAAGQDPMLSTDLVSQRDHDALAAGLKQMINESTEGLSEVRHSDGSVSVSLDDRFQSVTVAKDENGRLSQSCVDNPQAAGDFFNIDPKLIDKKSRGLRSSAPQE